MKLGGPIDQTYVIGVDGQRCWATGTLNPKGGWVIKGFILSIPVSSIGSR